MAYFPFMVEVSGRKCLIVGGGRIALRKAEVLLGFGVQLFVAAPAVIEAFRALAGGDGAVTLWEREFCDSDIDGMDFVVAATGVESVDRRVAGLCREKGVAVNAVDLREECTFIFPAVIREEDLLVAVSTGGQSPAAASWLRERIGGQIPEYYGGMVGELGRYREYILKEVDTPQERRDIFYQLLAYGDAHGGDIPREEVRRLVRRAKKFDT